MNIRLCLLGASFFLVTPLVLINASLAAPVSPCDSSPAKDSILCRSPEAKPLLERLTALQAGITKYDLDDPKVEPGALAARVADDTGAWEQSVLKQCSELSAGDEAKLKGCFDFEFQRRISFAEAWAQDGWQGQTVTIDRGCSKSCGPFSHYRETFFVEPHSWERSGETSTLELVDLYRPGASTPAETFSYSEGLTTLSERPSAESEDELVSFHDADGDGWNDLVVVNQISAKNRFSTLYLYDPQKQKYRVKPALDNIPYLEVDDQTHELSAGSAGTLSFDHERMSYNKRKHSFVTVWWERTDWLPYASSRYKECTRETPPDRVECEEFVRETSWYDHNGRLRRRSWSLLMKSEDGDGWKRIGPYRASRAKGRPRKS